MSSANAFVSHAINSTFIPRRVPLRYIVDYKEKYIHPVKNKYPSISKKYFQLRPLASPHVRPNTPLCFNFWCYQVFPPSENQNENISEILSVTCLGSDGKIRK